MAASLAGASRADAWLRERGVEFSIVEQEQATAKCRDSAAERGVSLRQIIKSMIYARSVPADSQGEDHLEYLHCMLPGHLHVDETKLQALAGGPCRLIESDELIRVTGAVVGAVHPFVPGVSKRLLDKRVQSIAAGGGQVSFNTGDMRVGVLVGYSDLMLALEGQAVVVDLAIAEPGEEYEELAQELSVSVSSARFLMETSFTEPYYRECLSHVASHQRSELAEGLVEWLRSLVRFASQADADAQGVSPLWLVRLACKTDATKYAREEALKAYLASGQAPPIPEAVVPADPALLDALVDETIQENSLSVDKLSGEGADSKAAKKLLTFLMGQVMKRSKGSFNPVQVRAAMEARLSHLVGS